MRDSTSRLTLAEDRRGYVKIGPAVRIGRFCEVHPGVQIRESNLDDDIEIYRDAIVERSQIRDGAIVGAAARLSETFVGSMTEIRSEPYNQTTIEGCVALGDEVTVYPGVFLSDEISVYPRLKLPGGIQIPSGVDLTGPADVLRYL
jgi:NDP-sugar pyrophosphorylase family protein